jgi:hypothetical protein
MFESGAIMGLGFGRPAGRDSLGMIGAVVAALLVSELARRAA